VNRCILSKQTHHYLEPSIAGRFPFKTNSNLTGNNLLYAPASNTDGQLLRDTCVSSPYLNRLIWSKMNHSPPWNSDLKEISFETLTQLSQGNNAIYTAASNIDDFPWRSTCTFSTQLNRPIWSKQSLSPPWKTKVAGSILFKS
jgi:hypothetical protein